MMDNEKLVFVAPVIEDSKTKTFTYDLYFSDTPEIVWAGAWDCENPAICDKEDIYPQEGTYNKIERINSNYLLGLAMNNSAYPLLYCINGILALSWIDLEVLDDYPESGRCVLKFGDDYYKVMEKIKELQESLDNFSE